MFFLIVNVASVQNEWYLYLIIESCIDVTLMEELLVISYESMCQ
jgi:hypothetical protein